MAVLLTIAAWALALIGTCVLVLAALWLADRVFTEILDCLGLKRAVFQFFFDRHKCTCGAVMPIKEKEDEADG